MKYTTIIAQSIAASVLALGLAAQASAVEETHTRVEVGSPAHGGTMEGYRIVQVEKEPGTSYQGASNDQLPSKVGNPMLGGNSEGLHRHNIEFVGAVDNTDHSASSDQNSLKMDLELRSGTRG
ncbi:hypothetical protein [Franzmannia qiaohouensis]|uniref:Uncharacterized protein n=1 Tax=Franzmannia qiaohouensis TaxID=1329370 RepID=A0ABU1HIJ2_9GAMM|nr:hypothetical protein [Halomonas qiaohouensis]MDR5906599.1 hypothetical protein [Halomonas qiaohouensis]